MKENINVDYYPLDYGSHPVNIPKADNSKELNFDYSSSDSFSVRRVAARGQRQERLRPQIFDLDNIVKTLGKLSINPDDYTVIGGANLVIRDIKTTTQDIDMLVSDDAFEELRVRKDAFVTLPPLHAQERGASNRTVHLASRSIMPTSAFTFLSGNGYYPLHFDSVRATSDIKDGIPIASIDEVIASKQALARHKDIVDLELIALKLAQDINIPEPVDYDPEY